VQDSISPQWTDVPEDLNNWLKIRRGQISEGKLTFLAHQIDFMALRGAKG
jgi:hypothetical protein